MEEIKIDRSKKIKKPVSIRQNKYPKKNFLTRSKILFQLDSYLLKNKNFSSFQKKKNFSNSENIVINNNEISNDSQKTNKSKEIPTKVFKNYFVDDKIEKKEKKKFLINLENLKIIFKNYFYHKKVLDNDLKKLSKFEKILLLKILKVKKEDFNKIKIQIILNNFFENFLSKNFQSKILNFTRKLYKQVNKRIFKKFINKNKKNFSGTEYLKKYLNFYFNNPKDELKLIINYCLFELKKKDVIVIFGFLKYTQKFDFEIDQLFEEKWILLLEKIDEFLNCDNSDEVVLEDIRGKISECSVIGFTTQYFKGVYTKLLI